MITYHQVIAQELSAGILDETLTMIGLNINVEHSSPCVFYFGVYM